MRTARTLAVLSAAVLAVGGLPACSGDGDALTVYVGRNPDLVQPLMDRLEDVTGEQVRVRYAGSSELAAQLLEEGEATEADLFFSQDAGALGALAKAGRLQGLPADVEELVAQRWRDPQARWVATSARARVLAYDPRQVAEADLPTSVDGLLDERWRGRLGYAPTNASFHAFVTALRVQRGEDGAREWLEAFAALEPQAYDNNIAVLEAVDDGAVAAGLINHYYWYEKRAEEGEEGVPSQLHLFDSGDPGSLVNVAGVGVLAGTEQEEAALEAVRFLLSQEAQQYFADETAEYPVVDGVQSTAYDLPELPPASEQQVDLNDLDSLDRTLALLDEVGLT